MPDGFEIKPEPQSPWFSDPNPNPQSATFKRAWGDLSQLPVKTEHRAVESRERLPVCEDHAVAGKGDLPPRRITGDWHQRLLNGEKEASGSLVWWVLRTCWEDVLSAARIALVTVAPWQAWPRGNGQIFPAYLAGGCCKQRAAWPNPLYMIPNTREFHLAGMVGPVAGYFF
jgi:hypothetical protein